VDGEGLTRYDLAKDEKTIFNRSQGLISDEINDICVDKVNGYIWVATNRGISRVALGYSARSSTIEEDVVYPNPFSFRRHKTIYFQRMPRNGTLRVYSLNGNLIKVPNAVRSGDDGAYYQWTPPSNLSPGTYFYVIVSPTIKKTGRIIITP
jgi:hypothetical protein